MWQMEQKGCLLVWCASGCRREGRWEGRREECGPPMFKLRRVSQCMGIGWLAPQCGCESDRAKGMAALLSGWGTDFSTEVSGKKSGCMREGAQRRAADGHDYSRGRVWRLICTQTRQNL